MEDILSCSHSKKIITNPIRRVDGTQYRLHICIKCGQRNFYEIKPNKIYCVIS